MIKIKIYKSENGNIDGFEVKGHAGYGQHGRDIVCSAVSILTQTAVLGIGKAAGEENVIYKIDDKGYLMCKMPQTESEITRIKCEAILDTMYIGLKNLQGDYGKYIVIVEEEV